MQDLQAFKAKVLAEGAAHYRALPWRYIDDAYGVLLSEVMLQQTQVARVDGRWQRWLEKFPSPAALAAAPLNVVLEEWQGMGYNRRAINLQRCAQRIVDEHAGEVPSSYDELVALPGVGPATAAGVIAFAFDQPSVYLETNVRAVFIHELFKESEQVSDKELIPLVQQTCPVTEVRQWYYALLDYGAHLKATLPNPSRRSKHYTRQSKFEGSHRQKRAFLLRRLLEGAAHAQQLADDLDAFEQAAGRPAVGLQATEELLSELEREGFALQADGLWHCAE